MTFKKLAFRTHAIQRMFERNVSEVDVRYVLEMGAVIEDYPSDSPFPSQLILGWCSGRPLHVVAAYDMEEKKAMVITVYEPHPSKWDVDFKRRVVP
ncbi:MAG: DUF4258 domain-containing protein [Chlamydiae bacterium]|nr:DUF4258 domain-containing protein [Chlamydiota bacterium]